MPDRERLKALFWSTPDRFLDDPAFSTEKTMTILCEGLAEDISRLRLQEIKESLDHRFFPAKVRKLWEEYLGYKKSRGGQNLYHSSEKY